MRAIVSAIVFFKQGTMHSEVWGCRKKLAMCVARVQEGVLKAFFTKGIFNLR